MNEALDKSIDLTMRKNVHMAVGRAAVRKNVHMAVDQAVFDAVDEAVNTAVHWAVFEAVKEDRVLPLDAAVQNILRGLRTTGDSGSERWMSA